MADTIQGNKEYFERFSKETNFHRDTLEKIYRLEDLLKEINNHPELNKGLVLKGGTAINFLYFKYPRLSIDLDFNFVSGIGKRKKDEIIPTIDSALRSIFNFKRYKYEVISDYGVIRYFLKYTNASNNIDRIKVEVNLLHRLSVLDSEQKYFLSPFGNSNLSINTLQGPELFAGKILALMDRMAPRDLYDIYTLLQEKIEFDKTLLKKIFIFFGCFSRKNFRLYHPDSIENITEEEIKRQLLPLLRKKEKARSEEMIKKVKPFLKREIFNFTTGENEYIDSFLKGEFKQEALFEKLLNGKNLARHPMVIWKQRHIKNFL